MMRGGNMLCLVYVKESAWVHGFCSRLSGCPARWLGVIALPCMHVLEVVCMDAWQQRQPETSSYSCTYSYSRHVYRVYSVTSGKRWPAAASNAATLRRAAWDLKQ